MPQVRTDSIFSQDDLLQIESALYAAKKEELVARSFLSVNQNFASYAYEVGYDWYETTGQATVIAAGSTADDVKYVGEKGGREQLRVLELRTAIRFTESERNMDQAKRAFGKGNSVQLDTLRVATARRLIAEEENRIIFVGHKANKVSGILNATDINSVDVADGTAGSGVAKKNWANKTNTEILVDLLSAKTALEKDGFFKARVLVLPPEKYLRLLKPYSDTHPMTVLSWLTSEGMYFEKIVSTNAVNATHNGLKISTTAVDAFLMIDNNPEVIEIGLPQDITIREPLLDEWGTSVQGIYERTTGIILRHPKGIYVGKGI
jgi:hypothetical protein